MKKVKLVLPIFLLVTVLLSGTMVNATEEKTTKVEHFCQTMSSDKSVTVAWSKKKGANAYELGELIDVGRG